MTFLVHLLQQLFGSLALRHIGSHSLHRNQQSQRIDQREAFASFDLFACVIPNRLMNHDSSRNALRIETGSTRAREPVCRHSHPLHEMVVDALPTPVIAPLFEVVVNR